MRSGQSYQRIRLNSHPPRHRKRNTLPTQPAMPTLLTLPSELRQRILTLLLPPKITLNAPLSSQIPDILAISHHLRLDVLQLIPSWSPLVYISHPHQIPDFSIPSITSTSTGITYTPKCTRICIDVFHDSDPKRINWTCYCGHLDTRSHPELVAAWMRVVPFLPLNTGIQEIYIDVTPAPAAKRRGHRLNLNTFISARCARKFLLCHVDDVAALASSISSQYNYTGKLKIGLTGTLSHANHSSYHDDVANASNVPDLEFNGTWISRRQGNFHRIQTAVHKLVNRQSVRHHTLRGQTHPFAWLLGVTWSKKTEWAWARIADIDEPGLYDMPTEKDILGDLEMLVRFNTYRGKAEVLVMDPAPDKRRKVQHCVAEDLGLVTESQGVGRERRVVVRKKDVKQRT